MLEGHVTHRPGRHGVLAVLHLLDDGGLLHTSSHAVPSVLTHCMLSDTHLLKATR